MHTMNFDVFLLGGSCNYWTNLLYSTMICNLYSQIWLNLSRNRRNFKYKNNSCSTIIQKERNDLIQNIDELDSSHGPTRDVQCAFSNIQKVPMSF